MTAGPDHPDPTALATAPVRALAPEDGRPRTREALAWLAHSLAQWPLSDEPSRSRFWRLAQALGPVVDEGPWEALPGLIAAHFAPRGWAWNGFYVRAPLAVGVDRLDLGHAAGPPVCTPLWRTPAGGIGASGACFDALALNQTIIITAPADYPGFVSCDGESGLTTRGSLVVPIRGGDGAPLAVWDLDATEPVTLAEAHFMEALLASLAYAHPPTPAALGQR